jgi:hypothetical protein
MLFKFLTYNKFKFKKWKRLSHSKRLKAYQELEIIQAKKHKRQPYKVIIKDLEEGVSGRCVSSERVIYLDVVFILNIEKRFFGMSVLFHEGRHAFQYEAINSKKKMHVFSKAYKWKKNFEGYVSGSDEKDKFSFYSMQPVERDAEHYSLKRLRQFRLRFKNEPDYIETLKREEISYDKVKEKAIKELGIFYRLRVAFRNWRERFKNNHRK